MENKYIVLGAILAILLFIGTVSLTGFSVSKNVQEGERAFVDRVVDGDTIVLEDGERVRLLGINTPERGQTLFKESTYFVKDLIDKREIILEKDITDRDKYDRLLRYVWFGDSLLNLELVERGFAKVMIYPPDEKYADLFLEAEESARERNIGIWGYEEDEFCLGIFYLRYNARNNDNNNLNDEYVIFRNFCTYPISLYEWVMKDEANKTFIFPDVILENKSYITVHSGSGQDNETDLFWGSTRAIWNNNGDRLRLWDSEVLLLDYSY